MKLSGACFTTSTSGDQCHAQIMTDISTNLGADTITFELKPKCGIRAVPGYPCRFVMQRSDDPGFDLDKFYDPYRLYFGHDIYGEVKKLFDQRPRGFLKLRSPGTLSTLPRDAVCEAISTVLRSTPILSRLAALQNYASIDEALPDFAAKLWEWLVEQCRLDPSIVIRHHYPHTLPSVEEFRSFEAVHDIGKVTEWLSIFLLGRMAMDVSLFLSFSPQAVGPPFNQVDEVDAGELFPGHRGKPLWCRLTVIDTDPKPFSKLPFYFGQLAKCKVKFEEHSPAVTE
ncbi:hypothetical protein Pmar_PMAR024491 [Perkinsus marinus ATCC 50983]|uniref:Inositol-pentakisphosphate 2-kinase n=1 Tax=Perkinsus marinus (strain ATCC 50983 / TXsc) TaxID=423536 RepID=C5LT46_PERM5|nr:hypothetical protein Pmar_PMAR024491 [Perkinsus marinus ATCC 50983]EER00014.1 hypothetical protein Pmar_PMAR024491 [Perkinsus marinus ATCC 50983]|eukprot:XP_002767296.1 hypothetical protein Pmar_PMAR024491 [Perkinsus marinus ATCC 50983]